MNVCLHFSYAVQISLQFDEFLAKNFKVLISRRLEIFTKNYHFKLVGTPCSKMAVLFWRENSNNSNGPNNLVDLQKTGKKDAEMTKIVNPFCLKDFHNEFDGC